MAEEIKETTEEVVETKDSADLYVENLERIKASTVDKTAYDRLAEENRKLANALANGEYMQEKAKEIPEDIKTLEDRVKHCKGKNDLELMTDVLKLRSARLAVDANDDIFVNQESAKASDYANAQAFADNLQEVIDSCDGDPVAFTARIRK